MTKAKRAFEPTELRTRYRFWELIATEHPTLKNRATVTGKKTNGEHFEIGRLKDMETALRMGRGKVDRLEGAEEWDANYTNGALQ